MVDAKTRYFKMEQTTLVLKNAAQKLRPYFQAYQMIVLTNESLQVTLHKLDLSERMLKWAIELSEYKIKYQPRVYERIAEVRARKLQSNWEGPYVVTKIGSFFNHLLSSNSLTHRHLQVDNEILISIHVMGNICPHDLSYFQPVEKLPYRIRTDELEGIVEGFTPRVFPRLKTL
uniref:Uncharacterized protein n=1 Tax=Vitis vinifera TaxID=29760 RepID=A5B172_VITVI|nr:hypothetical protein VITISV_025503 [Vitis vinifera]